MRRLSAAGISSRQAGEDVKRTIAPVILSGNARAHKVCTGINPSPLNRRYLSTRAQIKISEQYRNGSDLCPLSPRQALC